MAYHPCQQKENYLILSSFLERNHDEFIVLCLEPIGFWFLARIAFAAGCLAVPGLGSIEEELSSTALAEAWCLWFSSPLSCRELILVKIVSKMNP